MAQPVENIPPLLVSAREGRPPPSSVFPKSLHPLLVLLLLPFSLIIARLTEHIDLTVFRCSFKQVTGLPCAFCGGTRSFRALSHLNLTAALRWNPLATIVALTLLAGALTHLIFPRAATDRLLRFLQTLPWVKLAISLILLNWIYLIVYLPR
jgi:hypothetical protein